MGVLITLVGIPFYYVGVVWKKKPQCLLKFTSNLKDLYIYLYTYI